MGNKVIASPSFIIRRLQAFDAVPLANFYNRLSQASKRTFCPIGPVTFPEKCAAIAADNASNNCNRAVPTTKCDLIALYKGELIGWGFLWDLNTRAPTFGLAVADAYHRQNIGKTLMARVMNWAQSHALPEVHLTVVQDNEVAWRLYQKQGFVKTGEFTGDDGLLYFSMVATLITMPGEA